MLSPRRRLLLLLGVLVVAAVAAGLVGAPSPADLQDAFAGSGVAGAAGFAALYAGLTVALVPGAALTIAAGVVFGAVAGTVVSVIGATAGATVAFFVARRTSRATFEAAESERLEALDRRLRRQGLVAVIGVRLIPLAPFNALNYLAGATAVRARDYVLGTAVGIVPGAIAYATLGGSADEPGSPAFIGAVGLALALTLGGVLAARRG